jgi:hypothetical protein
MVQTLLAPFQGLPFDEIDATHYPSVAIVVMFDLKKAYVRFSTHKRTKLLQY